MLAKTLASGAGTIARHVRAGIALVLPSVCALCGDGSWVDTALNRSRSTLCGECESALRKTWPPRAMACRLCGMPRPLEPVPSHDVPCLRCPDPPFSFDRVVALGIYRDAIREAVVAAKLPRHSAIASAVGDLLGERVAVDCVGENFDLVTYVPTHYRRRVQRMGVGGAMTMATRVGVRLKRPCKAVLTMTRSVAKQSLLPDSERVTNVLGAFMIRKSYAWAASPDLRDRHILIVDDVLTSGATASEITRVLKQAGANRVTLAVVARAVRR